MKVQKIKFISFIIMMFMIVGGSALNAQRPDGPPKGQEGKAEMHQRGSQGEQGQKGPRIPGLTEEQKEQMKAIRLKSEKAALPLKNQVGEKEARLRTLTTSEDYNANAVNKVIEEVGAIKTELMKLKVATGQEIKQILTEEQLVFFNNHAGKGPGQGPKGKGPQQGRGR